jgi:hypothetical protein
MTCRLPWLLGLALLAGCAKPLEVGNITEIKPHTGSKGIDVYEPKRVAGQNSVPEFAGDQLVEVRTYTYREDSGEVELAGATCTLSAADYSATMQSPAKVRVPLYRGQSSTLAVACEMPGYKKRMVTISPYDATRSARYGAGAGSGLVGLVAVTAIDALSDNTKNDWRYPLARIVLERDPDKVASAH